MTAEEKQAARALDRWLARYRAAEYEIRTCKRQLVRLRGMARSLPSPALDASPVVSGQVSDITGQAAVAIAEASDDLHRRIVAALRVRREVTAWIHRIRDDRDRNLLEMRYVELMTYEQIAEEAEYYSAANVQRRIWRTLGRLSSG